MSGEGLPAVASCRRAPPLERLFAPSRLPGDGDMLLRPLATDDVAALVHGVRGSLDTLLPWLPWCHAGYGETDARAWISHVAAAWDEGSGYAFGIFDAGSGALQGGAGLSRVDLAAGSANLGYWVAAAHGRRGVATRAARLVAGWASSTIGLARVDIVTAVDNHASRRVAAKLGAVPTGGVAPDDRVLVDGRPSRAIRHVLALRPDMPTT